MGQLVCQAIDAGVVDADLTAVFDADEGRLQELLGKLRRLTRSMTLVGMVGSVDLVVECTNPWSALHMLKAALDGGKDILLTNPAALLGNENMLRIARERGLRILLPSLQLSGLDGLRAARHGRVDSCLVTVTLPPADLAGKEVPEEGVVFHGTAAEAIAQFPMLANQLALVTMVGVGPLRTAVRVLSSSRAQHAVYQVDIAGECGRLASWSNPVAAKGQPRRSKMVAYAAIGALENIFNTVRSV